MTQPSHEEIMKVRRYECSVRNHSWDIVETFGAGPIRLVCGNCGDSRRVLSKQATEQLQSLLVHWAAEAAASDEYSDRHDAYTDCADALRAIIDPAPSDESDPPS